MTNIYQIAYNLNCVKEKKKKEERSTLVDTTCTNSCLYDAKLTQYVLYFKLTQIKIRAVVVNSFDQLNYVIAYVFVIEQLQKIAFKRLFNKYNRKYWF